MHPVDRQLTKFEGEDLARLESASLQLSDPNLRFLLRQLIEVSGMADNPFASDPLTTAFNCGKVKAAQDFFDLLTPYLPDLYPRLLQEHLQENERRTSIIDRVSNSRE